MSVLFCVTYCVLLFLQQNPNSLLQRAWLAVIFSSLKKNTQFSDRLNLYRCLDVCLKAQTLNVESLSHWNTVYNLFRYLLFPES